MKVIHYQRRPVSQRYFSIENYFEKIREKLSAKGLQVHLKVSRYISQGFFKRLYNALEAIWFQADVNHVTGDVHYLTLFLAKQKTILTIHDCVFMKHPSAAARQVLRFFWLTMPIARSRYVTCISESTKREILRYTSCHESKIRVIPTVVNESLFINSPKPFNEERPIVLFIGTTPNKNLERVASALQGLPCVLEIVGPLSDIQKKSLMEQAIAYTNEVSISNERMAEKYRSCDLLLFPSTYEGFGMPILEAQLTGRPVITSNCSSMPEVAGESACLIDPFSVESIRNGYLKVVQDQGYRESLVLLGAENVKRFSSERVAEMYFQLYLEVYGRSKSVLG